jgi:TetR/AcrR family transcriptional repressor of lmrAB and yxaGH operons
MTARARGSDRPAAGEGTGATGTKGERTRAKLTAATAALLQRQGYHATGLAEIVAESGAPRGSLYFYFPGGKEELACAALAASGAEWRARIDAIIDGAPDLAAAVGRVCDELGRELEASGFANGCPLATVALETAASSDAVRRTVADHYDGWIAALAARVEGGGVPADVARRLARFSLATIEGALILAKVARSRAPLVEAGQTLQAMITLMARDAGGRRGRSAAAPPPGRRGRRRAAAPSG